MYFEIDDERHDFMDFDLRELVGGANKYKEIKLLLSERTVIGIRQCR